MNTGVSLRRSLCMLCAAGASFAMAGEDPFVRYIAGVEILHSARHLSPARMAAYYTKLCELTGVTAAEASKRLQSHAGNPEQWKQIQDQILAVLEEPHEEKKE